MAEDERQRIVKRANAGRKAARERGARFGRKPTLSAEQQADVVQLAARLRSTARSVCAGMSVAIRSLTCACQDPKTTCSRRVCPDALR